MDGKHQTVRRRRYTPDDVKRHASQSSAWVTWRGKVFDVTSFLDDHPGGAEFILEYAGRNVEEVMAEAATHEHSESAYEMMLDDFLIGTVHTDEETATGTVLGDDGHVDHEYHPEDTDLAADLEKTHFLDLSQPLFMQMWRGDFSKDFYLKQVHQPRHLKGDAMLFGPWYLEMFTKTNWYVVPAVWLPIAGYLFSRALETSPASQYHWIATMNPWAFGALFWTVGVVVWTLLEYTLHRFLFHVDAVLPDRREALCLHFLMHGIHHYLPMDKTRLVMPPLLFYILQIPFTKLAYAILPLPVAYAGIAGAFTMYVGYDCLHYALHHTRFWLEHMRDMKAYHLAHHYKNYELGYGVTSKIWDHLFGTELRI